MVICRVGWRALTTCLKVTASIELDRDAPELGRPVDDPAVLRRELLNLHPWRKGPLELGGVRIDTEWRSDWKWDR